MSEQDTDNDEKETGEQSASETADDRPAEQLLDEIAEQPTGDIDELLAEITGKSDDAEGDDTDEGTDSDNSVDPGDVRVEDELVETIEQRSAESVAAGIVLLRAELDEARAEIKQLEADLESERERAADLESRLKRKQADFQNYKKRQQRRMEEEKQRATEDLVARLLDVRDNLQRALEQDEETDIRGGVESTLAQFNQELEKENVEIIDPSLGDETDPKRHEVLATVASDQPEDTVANIHRPGYEMAGKVLRPAQVAVSDGSGHDENA